MKEHQTPQLLLPQEGHTPPIHLGSALGEGSADHPRQERAAYLIFDIYSIPSKSQPRLLHRTGSRDGGVPAPCGGLPEEWGRGSPKGVLQPPELHWETKQNKANPQLSQNQPGSPAAAADGAAQAIFRDSPVASA